MYSKITILCVVLLISLQTLTQTNGQVLLPVRSLQMDTAGKYHVNWQVAPNSGSVTFEVIVETLGYVGFGISPTKTMWEADIVLGGVDNTGAPYFADYHGVAPTDPTPDQSQDYDLLAASENGTHTTLKFIRLLDTGDEDDFLITENATNFIWSFGGSDQRGYHGPNRGSVPVNILSAE